MIRRIDLLIRRRATGCPSEFASRLNITERQLYRYLKFLREFFDMPIHYSKYCCTYFYLEEGCLVLGWQKNEKDKL